MDLQSTGLPHSEIPGSRVICTSPELIAAYRVLLRLREPRHPPVALSYFFFSSYSVAYLGGISAVNSTSYKVTYLAIKFSGFDAGHN